MPKIRDLGIKVIPETIRPAEVGIGGGCTDCTTRPFSICGGTQVCTDCTLQQLSICGGTQGCTDCTTRPFSICGGTPAGCGASVAVPAMRGCGCTLLPTQLQCEPFSCGFPTNAGCTAACSLNLTNISRDCPQPPPWMPVAEVQALHDQMRRQLDQQEKDALDQREAAINAELEELKRLRKTTR